MSKRSPRWGDRSHGTRSGLLGLRPNDFATSRSLAIALALRTHRTRGCVMAADVRKPEDVEAALDRTLSAFGAVDIVINGAAGDLAAPG